MTTEIVENFTTVLLWLVSGFVLLHIICSSIASRIMRHGEWTKYVDVTWPDENKTNDTGPK